jgi:hypothetical protein
MLWQNKKRKRLKKRKLLILLAIFSFLGILLGLWKLEGGDFYLLEREKIFIPVLPPTEEERLKELLSSSGLELRSIESSGDYFKVNVSGNLLILFSKKREYLDQIASLQFILNRSKIEGRIPKKIDLRFTNPILTY